MHVLGADATRDRVSGLVHLETQRADVGLDLTVDRIDRVVGGGRLDFGGSEFEPARTEPLEPELTAPNDDYGWWELDAGRYLVRYNEALEISDGRLSVVHPLPRLLRAGASHPAFVPDGTKAPLEVLLAVGEAGCALKENCRISRLVRVESR